MKQLNIDGWLIDNVFDPAAHKIEYVTGVNAFGVSRYAIAPWMAACITIAMNAPDAAPGWVRYLLVVVVILGTGGAVFNAFMAEWHASKPGMASLIRHSMFWIVLRYAYIGFAAGGVVALLAGVEGRTIKGLIADVSFLTHMYFLACSKMPPNYAREQEEKSLNAVPEAM